MSYKVKLPLFEGPFDLLVYLIENSKMNIYDIQISQITEQYLEYIRDMKKMDFNVASEFMVLAATLLDIKSKMILPRTVEIGETTVEDPRSQLVERIIEYKQFKECANLLKECREEASLMYEKPQEDISEYVENPDELLNLDIVKFAKAFELFLSKKKREDEVRSHYVRRKRDKATMEMRISYMKEALIKAFNSGFDSLNMKKLIPNPDDNYDVVVTFSSLLQMMRNNIVDANQEYLYGDIMIDTAVNDSTEPLGEEEEVE